MAETLEAKSLLDTSYMFHWHAHTRAHARKHTGMRH